jgi:hypothetical protein
MQIQFDFNGKKDKRITFAVDDDLDALLKKVAKKLNRDDVSCLAREYVIECATRDMGKLMLMESRGEKRFVDMGTS